jgi:hypothetical protein
MFHLPSAPPPKPMLRAIDRHCSCQVAETIVREEPTDAVGKAVSLSSSLAEASAWPMLTNSVIGAGHSDQLKAAVCSITLTEPPASPARHGRVGLAA